MKICFPVRYDSGLKSVIHGHFGSAPLFLAVDTDTREFEAIANQDLDHLHGQCNPMKALDGRMVDAVVVGGIGAGAITGLNQMGIKVYKSETGIIHSDLELITEGRLKEMTMSHTCGGHDGGCAHGSDLKPLG